MLVQPDTIRHLAKEMPLEDDHVTRVNLFDEGYLVSLFLIRIIFCASVAVRVSTPAKVQDRSY